MKQTCFSIYDEKAKAFLPPFFLPNEGMALRTFSDCCNSDTHQFGVHPEDYALYKIGTFDDEKGSFDLPNGPELICIGLTLIKPKLEVVPDEVSNDPPVQQSAASGDSPE